MRFLPLLLLTLLPACATEKLTWQDWPTSNSSQLPPATAPLTAPTFAPPYRLGDPAILSPDSALNLAMRNPDFPQTHIHTIHIDLTSPFHYIRLTWSGSPAPQAPAGPFRSCPGRGRPSTNCDDITISNKEDSFCTPKGVFPVAGFADHLEAAYSCTYATWVVHAPRYIAMHYHADVATTPRSEGCIRLTREVAQLIHNNSIAGVTLISITGRWSPARDLAP